MTAARARSSRACSLVDVEEGLEAPDGGEHGQRGLDVDADVAGVDGDGERLGGRQAGVEGAVDEQAPDVAEGDVADQVLDVDAPVPECAALLVRFGDLRLERDDSFESGYEVGHQAAPLDVCDGGSTGGGGGVRVTPPECSSTIRLSATFGEGARHSVPPTFRSAVDTAR